MPHFTRKDTGRGGGLTWVREPVSYRRVASGIWGLTLYNALNASDVVTLNTNFGPSWRQPTSFLPGRLYEIGGQWSF